jgi:hypothetical protein
VMNIFPLNEETMDLEIDLCLRCHPSGFVVPEGSAEEGRRTKKAFLKKVFGRVKPAGFVAAENGRPVALLELMPRDYARRNGYITGSTGRDEETLTIVCLEVALNQDRRKVMDGMVAHLADNLGLFQPFKRIEVGAFPQDVDFHPAWVYEDNGFKVVEDRGVARVLSISVP